MLLVAPLSGHHATLLRDTVRTLLAEHDVWVTDWVDARMVPLTAGPFHLADYVDYVREWIRFLSPDLHVISVCQPTVPVLAAVSLHGGERAKPLPRTMVMMGGPIDARRSPTAVNNLARTKPYSWFEQNVIQRVPAKYPGYMRRVYPGLPAAPRLRGDESGPPPRSRTGTTTTTWSRATASPPTRTGASTTSTTRCSTCRPSTTSTR